MSIYGIQLSEGMDKILSTKYRAEQIVAKVKIPFSGNTNQDLITGASWAGGNYTLANRYKVPKEFVTSLWTELPFLGYPDHKERIWYMRPEVRVFFGTDSGHAVSVEMHANSTDGLGKLNPEDLENIHFTATVSSFTENSYAAGPVSGNFYLVVSIVLPSNLLSPKWGVGLYNKADEAVYYSGYEYLNIRGMLDAPKFDLWVIDSAWNMGYKYPTSVPYNLYENVPLMPHEASCVYGRKEAPGGSKEWYLCWGHAMFFPSGKWGYRVCHGGESGSMVGGYFPTASNIPEGGKIPFIFASDYF